MSVQSPPHSLLPSSRESLLEQCPPEICKKIFIHACDDNGYTGRSLSLVSRYIHDVSEDVKYRSLAVWSMRQILNCYAVLINKPPHLRRIMHLFISAHEQVCPGETEPVDDYQWSIDMHYKHACESFFGILEMAAPTVRTFYICSSIARPTILLKVPMPNLVELTLFNGFPSIPTVMPPTVDYPCLKRLRFTGFTDHSPATFHEILIRAPNVTHIFFQSQKTADDLLEHIASVFGLDPQQTLQFRPFDRFPDEFLDKIEEVRVEAPNKRKGFYALLHDRTVRKVMELEPRIKVITVPAKDRVDSDYAMLDWLRNSTREWKFPIPHKFID